MPIFQLNPEIGRRDYQTVEVLGEIGQSIIGAQDEVKLLAHGGRHQEEHVPGNVSPAQSLFPAPKGRETSSFRLSLPCESRNLSGRKFSGSDQTRESEWKAYRLGITMVS